MTKNSAARHLRPRRVPAQVEPEVEALGLDLAVAVILHFGGTELYIRRGVDVSSELAALVGPDGVAALAGWADRLPRRVPLAKPWLAAVMAWRGESVHQIARTLRTTDVTVRKWLGAAGPAGRWLALLRPADGVPE